MATIFFAVGGVAFYTIYSRKSREISKVSSNEILSAIILYFLASLILFLGSGIASLYWTKTWATFDFPLYTQLKAGCSEVQKHGAGVSSGFEVVENL